MYGLPKGPVHWFFEDAGHHRNTLDMTSTELDPCFFDKRDAGGQLSNLLSLKIDDSQVSGTKSFRAFEDKGPSRYPNKGIQPVFAARVTPFAGTGLRLEPDGSIPC
jgi:hypothetical protein